MSHFQEIHQIYNSVTNDMQHSFSYKHSTNLGNVIHVFMLCLWFMSGL